MEGVDIVLSEAIHQRHCKVAAIKTHPRNVAEVIRPRFFILISYPTIAAAAAAAAATRRVMRLL